MAAKAFPYSLAQSQKKVPVFLFDAKGEIRFLNEAVCKLVGLKEKELLGKKLTQVFPKNFSRLLGKLAKDCVKQKTLSSEFGFTNNKGQLVEGKINIFYTDKQQPFTVIINTGENIERLKSEIDAVNRIADHNLKKLVKTNEKLQEARQAEQEALNIKEKFLTNISHELRTPLTGISGITQLLAKTRLNPQQKEYVDNILRSAENLVSIINELLDLSKIKSGKFELDIREFSLYECLKNVASAFSIISNNKNITFNFSYDKNIPPILLGDSLRISQIINNLLNNAFKFTEEGYIHLNVNQRKLANGTAWVDFEVSDTGIGIEKEKVKAIFEEFRQAEAGTSRLYGGTGLGLSICQHLVRLHHGEIQVKSKPKKGSSFFFTLPLPIGKKIRQSDTRQEERLKGVNFLVADDNMVNILVIENILKKEGAHVINAVDGKEAYQKFKTKDVDIILLDLNMPKMDGYELARLLRKKERSVLPIVAITAGNPDSVEKKCAEAGFTDIIFKPFRNEDFVSRLGNYLKKEKAGENRNLENNSKTPPAVKAKEGVPDFSTIASIAGDDKEVFNDLIRSIILNISAEIPKLRAALHTGKHKDIYFVAHKIKTSYGYVGMVADLERLKSIEQMAENNGSVKEMTELFGPVENSSSALIKTLEASLKQV